METLNFEYEEKGPLTRRAHVGVVGSGDLEVLIEPSDKPGAQVRLTFARLGHTFATTTDGAGKYRIGLAPGIYAVRASAGMSMRPRNINVRAPRL